MRVRVTGPADVLLILLPAVYFDRCEIDVGGRPVFSRFMEADPVIERVILPMLNALHRQDPDAELAMEGRAVQLARLLRRAKAATGTRDVWPYLEQGTHIYNPQWPPHAKFHNGQTMSMGVLLGLSALFFLFRRAGDADSNLLAATVSNALYWVSQAMAFLYPGVAWTDPFLLKPGETLDQFPLQGMLNIGTLTSVAIGFALIRSSNRAGVRTLGFKPDQRVDLSVIS